ncbi:sigma-70 family RNA polymerase sigma factor [Terasakiella sp. A23]|uniref:sigma-70 family RNA polymerase sigma factor n=1 Tax=Terasakiella sp. FCG-A23 TaxID=3080561 RepID=UPI002954405A|nr:sigma-70 family RNA polymerase sigma factor [Terasakiella sp. A23]MDV7341267.1 sigma-70 family RNA polymerase sigma factor [Terasakiella sp. A23]
MQDHKTQPQQASLPDTQELTALLVKVSVDRDKQAFAVLFEHFAPRVKSYVFKLGSDETMAEELAQQTLLQVWRKAHLFNADKAAASTWIFRIARNLRLDLLRKEKHYDYDDHDFSQIEDERENADVQVDRHQHAVIVRSALQKLPAEQIQIVQLSFYEGLSHGEIAKRLDVPLGTVKSRMRLAFKRIKDSVGGVL